MPLDPLRRQGSRQTSVASLRLRRLTTGDRRLTTAPDDRRTLWHAPDTHGARARCGDAAAVIVTDDRRLVTCPACRAALEAEEEGEGER